MRAVDLIRQKRDGGVLGADAIRTFVAGVTDGSWPDYQIAALLMAIVWRGMSLDEATVLTDAMIKSGERVDLSEFGAIAVDKHSTGGVGDKTSLILPPHAPACGALVLDVKVGRGACMKTEADARRLATWLAGIAERSGVRTQVILTSMDAPLGRAVGNVNEVIESIETLKGRGPKDLEELSIIL